MAPKPEDMRHAMNPQAGVTQPQAPQVHSVPRRSPFGALLTRTLPDYSGPYDVGVCDVEVPVKSRTFGTFRHKALANSGSAGLVMDTVMFSMFYPTEKPAVPVPVMWFPKCVSHYSSVCAMISMRWFDPAYAKPLTVS